MFGISFSLKDAPTSRLVHLFQVLLQFLAAIIAIGVNASDIAYVSTNAGVLVRPRIHNVAREPVTHYDRRVQQSLSRRCQQ